MKKTTIFVLCICAIVTTASAQLRMSEGSKKVATTMAIIENLYVDEVNDQKLSEDAIRALLEKLDPHSTYASAEEVKEMNEPLEGNFDGIGISFNMMTDTLYVIETISGGPSERVGIRPGDKIIYVNDTLIAGVKRSNKDIMSRLRGPKGTSVNVKVLRKGEPQLLEFKIVRAKIPIYSLDAAYMIDKHVGYIRLSRFGATTTKEFQEAAKKLKAEGMQSLILDLENNGGGYLSAAIELADEFLEKDRLIVYTEGSRQPKKLDSATAKGSFEQGKLVILINEGSASASEIVSGAVQDWDRGIIVGRRSFGKGLVQRQIPLPDESMIRLTVARYYTPTGRCIQKPYTSGDKDAYEMDVIERYNKGEMMSADSIHFPDSLKYQTLINKRTVYGGGGIMPDYFVPVDTTAYPMYLRQIVGKGVTLKISHNEVDNNRKEILAKYPNAESFYKNYTISEEIMQKVIAAGEEEKVEFNEKEYEKAKPFLAMQIKALMARDLYDMATYFKIINDYSDIYKKAYEIIRDDKQYEDLLRK
ncbi:S41 family peptidase [Dysgonomonas sp. ZJ709]|uniref:S41 family peptidase n=1 Tax=Dysgonomonas sp. ZJ709 TaxID=2709797 RepID=UPI0013EA23CD|nr:S41 family peptidase [Dysgonomonas sp. ZJ709]